MSIYYKMFKYEELLTNKKDIIKLEDMDYDTTIFKMPKIYLEAITQMYKHNTFSYSDFGGLPKLISLLKKYDSIKSEIEYEYDVFVSSGTGILLHTAFDVIGEILKKTNKTEVILFAPEYSLFQSICVNKSLKTVIIHGERANNFLVTIEQIKKTINSRTGAIVFSNPNNPTGGYYEKEWLENLVELAKKNNLYIIVDEVYRNMIFESNRYYPIEKANGGYDRLIKVYGLSKDRPGLNGIRVSYCSMDKHIYERFKEIQVLKNFSNSIISDYILYLDTLLKYYLEAGIYVDELSYYDKALIKEYSNVIENNISLQRKNTDIILEEIRKTNVITDYIIPISGNSIFFKHSSNYNPDVFVKKMIEKGVFLYGSDVFLFDFNKYGNWTRVCITKDIEVIKRGLRRLENRIKAQS